jgi:tartrate dehydrogenase/decarboxylase/D-malate dehydrogenase
MLDHLGETPSHDRIVEAIARVLAEGGPRTPDLGGRATTDDVARAVRDAL